MTRWFGTLVLTLSTLLLVLSVSSEAHARKGLMIVNTGDDIFVAGDGSIPEPFGKTPELAGAQAGYKCKVFGVFWAYFTISECTPVAFKDDTYYDEPKLVAAIAQAHPEDTMEVGLWKKHGRILIVLAILAMVGIFVWSKFAGADDDEPQPAQGQ